MSAIPKACSTCEHKRRAFFGSECGRSGFLLVTERKYPTACGHDFQGWAAKLGIVQRVTFWWKGSL